MLFNQFVNETGIKENTIKGYKSSLKCYCKLNNKSFDELIKEAEEEEEQGVRWKNRKIRKRLIDYRKWLYYNKSEGTARTYFIKIKSLYRHFEIEIHKLPNFSIRGINPTYEKTEKDILTKTNIKEGYLQANNTMKNFILLEMTTGISKTDILNLTIQDLLNSCSEYLTDKSNFNLMDQVKELKKLDQVVPTFEGIRQKTGTKFITFSTPEFIEHICEYLIYRDGKIKEKYNNASNEEKQKLPKELTVKDKLIDLSDEQIMASFREINNNLNFGTVGHYVKFRSHQLRAYHATTLLNLNNPFTINEIDVLQGRKKDKTHRAYLIESTKKLKDKYIEGMESLYLFKTPSENNQQVNNKLYKENKALNNEIKTLKKEIEIQKAIIEKQENKIDELKTMQEKLLNLV